METNEDFRQRATEQLVVAIEGRSDSDLEELAQLAGQLRRQLLELDVEDVELARDGATPPGAKAVDAVTVGALVVTLAPTAVQGVIGIVRSWFEHRPVSGIKITLGRDSLELTHASADQLDQLTRAFIARHPTS